jgi:tRNA G10  N-methylase Trm11
MIYLFTLGRTSSLCFQELESLLKIYQILYKIIYQEDSRVIIETVKEIDTKKLINQSGGIIKISSLLFVIPAQAGIQALVEKIGTSIVPENHFKNFGISLIGFQANIQDLSEQIKSKIKLHYSLPKSGHELSSAQISNKNFLEIVIVKTQDDYQIFQTIEVQDIDHWTKKDIGRPNIDDRLGMLPLKVARMMINLSLAAYTAKPEGRSGVTLLDPFCGMGSILEEALDLGINHVIGSDINAGVLDRCKNNTEWFKNNFNFQKSKTEFVLSDAVKISEHINNKIDLIVTEPFLGDAKRLKALNSKKNNNSGIRVDPREIRVDPREIRVDPSENKTQKIPENTAIEIRKIVKGLEKMYLGALKDWKKVIKTEGMVCIIVPEFEVGKQTFLLPFVEICGKLGYNIVSKQEYSRENAVVKRKIYLLKQKKIEI